MSIRDRVNGSAPADPTPPANIDDILVARALLIDRDQSTTPTQKAQGLENLGLGNSAPLDVGTTAGTVAAGDDPRFSDVPAASLAATIHAATSKTTPVDADELPLSDSAASWGLKKLTWANIKAALAGLFVSRASNLSDLASASTARTNLGLVIGTNVLAPTGNGSGLTGLVSAQITDATDAATSNTVVIRDAGGSASFSSVSIGNSGIFCEGSIEGTNVGIKGVDYKCFIIEGPSPFIQNINLYVPTEGGKYIATTNSSDGIPDLADYATAAGFADSATVSGQATSSESLATSRNIFGIAFDGTADVSGDATNAGHFASIISGGTAGHFVGNNGTTPTLIAGRSAWFADGSGNPSFKNGTGSAVTLVRSSDLGTNVATFLATPTSANLAAAITNETGSGSLVFATSPTLVTPLLGTPTSGTLTSCTGYSVKNLADVQFSLAATDLVRAAGVSGSDLTATLASGKTYRVNAMVKMTGSAGGSFVSSISGPNCSFGISFYERAGFEVDTIISSLSPLGTSNLHSNTGATSQTIKIEMIIKTSASGTLTFGWTAVSATGTRNAGSYLRVELLD